MSITANIPPDAGSDLSIDRKMVATARFVLAFGALLIIFIDKTEPDRFVFETYTLLVLYTLYSFYVLLAVRLGKGLPEKVADNLWWIDTAAYLLLISLSSGTNSIFFFFFFFAVITASFEKGFFTGLKVALISAAGFFIIGLLMPSSAQEFDLGRFLSRPLSLVVIGYMMSYWGGYENRSRRRLALLRRIGAVSNPRFGIDRTISVNLELIRSFYKAEGALMISEAAEAKKYRVYYSKGADSMHHPSTLDENAAFAKKLLSPPADTAAILQKPRFSFFKSSIVQYSCFDFLERRYIPEHRQTFTALIESLDVDALLTVPVYSRGRAVGRIFVYGPNGGVFVDSDITFLAQAVDHFIPVVENIRLVDNMASGAADQERKRIARDIHDSIIQPYVGLQIGIDSLSQMVEGSAGIDAMALSDRVGRLKVIARDSLEDLRSYVHGLSDPAESAPMLVDSIRRYTEKFKFATGITVDLDLTENLEFGDRLAAEVFQIIIEGLSNVRRHSRATRAGVKLYAQDHRVVVEITNEGSDGDFRPRSIARRSESLGGEAVVSNTGGITTVAVSIPL